MMDIETVRRIANVQHRKISTTGETPQTIEDVFRVVASLNSKGGWAMEGYSENPDKNAFWDEIIKLNPDLAVERFKTDNVRSQFSDWTLKTMPIPVGGDFIGFAYYSPSGMVRVTNYNLGNRGKMKRKKYHIDIALQPGLFKQEGATVLESDSETEAFRQALMFESVQVDALHKKKMKELALAYE